MSTRAGGRAVSRRKALAAGRRTAAQRRLSGRDAEDPLVQPLPIRRDRALHGAETDRASADHRMQSVLEPVLHPEPRARVELLRVEVRDVVGAAELQARRCGRSPTHFRNARASSRTRARRRTYPTRGRSGSNSSGTPRSRSPHSSACCSTRPASSADQGSGRACNRRSSFDGQEAPSRQRRPSPTSSVRRVSLGTGWRLSFPPATPPLPGDANRSPDGAGKSCTCRRGNARSPRPARRSNCGRREPQGGPEGDKQDDALHARISQVLSFCVPFPAGQPWCRRSDNEYRPRCPIARPGWVHSLASVAAIVDRQAGARIPVLICRRGGTRSCCLAPPRRNDGLRGRSGSPPPRPRPRVGPQLLEPGHCAGPFVPRRSIACPVSSGRSSAFWRSFACANRLKRGLSSASRSTVSITGGTIQIRARQPDAPPPRHLLDSLLEVAPANNQDQPSEARSRRTSLGA